MLFIFWTTASKLAVVPNHPLNHHVFPENKVIFSYAIEQWSKSGILTQNIAIYSNFINHRNNVPGQLFLFVFSGLESYSGSCSAFSCYAFCWSHQSKPTRNTSVIKFDICFSYCIGPWEKQVDTQCPLALIVSESVASLSRRSSASTTYVQLEREPCFWVCFFLCVDASLTEQPSLLYSWWGGQSKAAGIGGGQRFALSLRGFWPPYSTRAFPEWLAFWVDPVWLQGFKLCTCAPSCPLCCLQWPWGPGGTLRAAWPSCGRHVYVLGKDGP